jgi:mono/diheme cytochrome c family protein
VDLFWENAMKRYLLLAGMLVIVLVALFVVSASQPVQAGEGALQNPDIPKGAALYDKWYAALGKDAPPGDMPIWSRQSTNTRHGPDTWRCVECHGWDYQGKDGAYHQGSSHYTGFPSVYKQVQTMSIDDIVGHLKGAKDPSHNFSMYMDDTSLNALAQFLKNGLIDNAEYIDAKTLRVKGGNLEHGTALYNTVCATCHGDDGQKIAFRVEGIDANLGWLATSDPWLFLHKSRFGNPGTHMAVGYDQGWTPQDGRDVLLFAQSLPGSDTTTIPTPAIGEGEVTAVPLRGGPPKGILGGISTALAAMAAGLGFNILVAAVLVGILLLIVWAVRQRK